MSIPLLVALTVILMVGSIWCSTVIAVQDFFGVLTETEEAVWRRRGLVLGVYAHLAGFLAIVGMTVT